MKKREEMRESGLAHTWEEKKRGKERRDYTSSSKPTELEREGGGEGKIGGEKKKGDVLKWTMSRLSHTRGWGKRGRKGLDYITNKLGGAGGEERAQNVRKEEKICICL